MFEPVIIYEDNHLLIVQKPPGYLAQGDGSAKKDVLSWAGHYLARNKPGRAFVGLVHRLDGPVGGVMALAKTSKCASRLSGQFRERKVKKIYWALVHRQSSDEHGIAENMLVRDGSITRLAKPGEKGTDATLSWRVLASYGETSLLEVDLLTGFKHQIRAQLSALEMPIVGDIKYGSPATNKGPAIGLWAVKLSLEHPTKKEIMHFVCCPPQDLYPWNLGPELKTLYSNDVKAASKNKGYE